MFKSRRKSTASNQDQPGYFDINTPSPTFSTYSSPRDIQQRPYSAIGYNSFSTGSRDGTRLPSLNEALNGSSYLIDSSPASSMRSFNVPSYASSNGFPQTPASPNSFDPRKASPGSFSRRASDAASYNPYGSEDMRSKKPKKLSPGSCQVCGATSTPEWRKSVAGPRTLCNACGLAAAKISNGSAEPTSLNEVLDALRTIGKIRFRVVQFELPPGAQERAAATWNPPVDSASSGYSSYSSSGRSSVSIPGSASSYNSASSNCPPTPSSYASRQSFSTSPQETDAAFTLASLCGSSPPSVNSAQSSLTTPPVIDRGGYFSLGQRPQSSMSLSSPYGASRDLDRQARRLSAMSLDLQGSEAPAPDPPRASTDSGRMSLASLMNPPDTSSSRSRRFSFGSSSSSSSKRPSTFSF